MSPLHIVFLILNHVKGAFELPLGSLDDCFYFVVVVVYCIVLYCIVWYGIVFYFIFLFIKKGVRGVLKCYFTKLLSNGHLRGDTISNIKFV